jgi:hypothetical protein
MDGAASLPASVEEQPSGCAVDLEPHSPAVLFSPLLPLPARFRSRANISFFLLLRLTGAFMFVCCVVRVQGREGEKTGGFATEGLSSSAPEGSCSWSPSPRPESDAGYSFTSCPPSQFSDDYISNLTCPHAWLLLEFVFVIIHVSWDWYCLRLVVPFLLDCTDRDHVSTWNHSLRCVYMENHHFYNLVWF